ncbi:cytochrome c oxidase assembly protein [Lacipirellula parvula]|uniref:Cytochrome c oxidase n=1 Tax=Lacipirellula parvula TaxID=2650471 RepID=A0A5K7XG61_9BACT|nr:cytochrome c oxidase assembly protein [Lacipirellula parvula]BBO35854.1 cytochrome c oxidase [Lacipirellula parvula]
MSPTLDAFVRSWPSEPWLVASLLLSAAIYVRGWRSLHRRDPERWSLWRLASFCGGLFAIFLALASPLEPFASLWLQIHMVQHLLLMMVAPPLLWLGWPLLPTMLGLPKPIRSVWVAPLLRSRRLRNWFTRLTHPLVAWPIYVGVTWFWHAPRFYDLALSSTRWHFIEHLLFAAAALLFWYPVVRPYPSRPNWSPWLLLPYLLLADVQNTVLAAWLTFSSRVIYPHYANAPRIAGVAAIDDQAAAGVIMWVPGSIAFLLPLFLIAVRLLRGQSRTGAGSPRRTTVSHPLPFESTGLLPILSQPSRAPSSHRFDLLHTPLIGALLRWRYFRPLLQYTVGVLAVAVILDGLLGPQLSPLNLAGVLPWIHWRGVLILGLLIAGNLFCMACPFTLPRGIARRFWQPTRSWPRVLRNKWLAVVLVALFLWSYEAFALWDSPWLTAWIALAYFGAALLVDSIFAGASFCKYVCPIGQFNFMQSLISPLEVTVRDANVCTSCKTKECIRGSATLPGCEMGLYQPRKAGNFDCTFCLDCVQVCPHENVGILATTPGGAIWSDRLRSGIGRWSARPDVAALAIVLVCGAFANAAGMIAPVLLWQDQLRERFVGMPPLAVTTAFYACALIALPALVLLPLTVVSRHWGIISATNSQVAARFAMTLVPLGFGVWLAHYSFHFLASWDTIIPATQRFASDLGVDWLGPPAWICACCRPAADWIIRFELLAMGAGLLLTLYAVLRVSESFATSPRRVIAAAVPWCAAAIILYASGVWIMLQPMEMRGTLPDESAAIAQQASR